MCYSHLFSLIDHGSPDPWGHSSQLGPGSYSGSAGSYSNSYSMHPRDGMVSHIKLCVVSSFTWGVVGEKFVFCFYVMMRGFVYLFVFRAMFVVFLFQP